MKGAYEMSSLRPYGLMVLSLCIHRSSHWSNIFSRLPPRTGCGTWSIIMQRKLASVCLWCKKWAATGVSALPEESAVLIADRWLAIRSRNVVIVLPT